MNKKIILLSVVCSFLYCKITIAKEMLHFKIQIPASYDADKVQVMLDDGLGEKFITVVFEKSIAIVKKEITSTYATIIILYPDTEHSSFAARLLINAASHGVIFLDVARQPPLSKYILKNTIDIDKCREALALRLYCKKEFSKNLYYGNQYHILNNDTSIANYNKASKELALKALTYIKTHGNSYYFFWYFRLNIVNELLKTQQLELYEIFNTAFPAKFKESYEGKKLKSLIEGNLFIKKGNLSPEFSVQDYKGNIIATSQLKNKYVLLAFWATWCKPCREEIPMLKKIRQKYAVENLEMVSLSYDKDTAACIKVIAELKMNWTHVFAGNNLSNLFGNKPIPSVYLIGPGGNILFSSWEDGPEVLSEILENNLGVKKK